MIERLPTRKLFALLAGLALILYVPMMLPEQSTLAQGSQVQSSESGFVSISPAGIGGGAIIPASCESGLGEGGFSHFAGDTFGNCTSPPVTPVNGACAATHYNCTTGQVPPAQQTCTERQYCSGTVVSLTYCAPGDCGRTIANNPLSPATFGYWENQQCGTYGYGWYAPLSTCDTGQGTGYNRITEVNVESGGQGVETATSFTWSCAGSNGGTTASCIEAKNACYPDPNPANYGSSCSLTSSQNVCGQTTSANTGTYDCSGQCVGIPPAPPPDSDCTVNPTPRSGCGPGTLNDMCPPPTPSGCGPGTLNDTCPILCTLFGFFCPVPSGCGPGTLNNMCPLPTPSGCGPGTLNDMCPVNTGGAGGTGGGGGGGTGGGTGGGGTGGGVGNNVSCVVTGGISQRICSGSAPGSYLIDYNNCGAEIGRQICLYGCSRGACNPPPPVSFIAFQANTNRVPRTTFTATGHLQVRPLLVRQGDPTWLYWNVQDARSCTVTGTNNQSWSNVFFSGADGRQSAPIQGHTEFTLRCASLPGVTPREIAETQVVDIAPIYQEV